jgi:hypothetical protein
MEILVFFLMFYLIKVRIFDCKVLISCFLLCKGVLT